MGWWDRWVWSRVANREALRLEQLLAEETTPTHAGVPVGTDQALRLSAVWSCVRLLSDAVSLLPLDVYRRGERDPPPELPPLLRTPAAGLSLNEWLYAAMVSLLLRGNAYGIVTGRSGSTLLPAQVDLAHPDRMAVTVTPDGRVSYRLNGEELVPDTSGTSAPIPSPAPCSASPRSSTPARRSASAWPPRRSGRLVRRGQHPSGVQYVDRDPGKETARSSRPNGWPPAATTGSRPCSAGPSSSPSA